VGHGAPAGEVADAGKHWGGRAMGIVEDSPAARLLWRRKGATGVGGGRGGLHGSGRGRGGRFAAQIEWTVNRAA
jgi:hypothetical protein